MIDQINVKGKKTLTYTGRLKCFSIALIAFVLLFQARSSFAQEISIDDPSRFMDWKNAGADTSVRSQFKKTYQAVRYGIRPGKTNDNATLLRNLLKKAKPYSIIQFPEGEFQFNSSVDVPSNIIIRGAGVNKTKFNFKTLKLGQRGVFNMASYERLHPTDVTKPVQIGDNEIHVKDISGYAKGDIIELFMENDSALMYTQARWKTSWGSNARGQILEIDQVNTANSSIKVNETIRLAYPLNMNPRVHKQEGTKHIGFEDFTIENYIEEDMIMFYFRESRHCWIDNVKSINVVKHHVLWEASSRCSVLNSCLTGALRYDGGGHGYGVAASNHTSDCLVENCSFIGLRHALMTKKGANGNVFLYNYCDEGIWDRSNTGRPPATLSIHGHFSFMNLFEGNIVERITSGDFWGPSGPGTTFNRNIVLTDDLEIRDASLQQNLIGNLVLEGKIKVSKEAQGTLRSGNIVSDLADATKVVTPSSFVYSKSPDYFGPFNWPITSNYTVGSIALPAQQRYIQEFKP